MQTFKDVWQKSVDKMAEYISSVSLNLWIKNLTPIELNKNNIVLYIPSTFQRDIILSRYSDIIKSTMAEVLGFDIEIKIYTEDDKPSNLIIDDKAGEACEPEKFVPAMDSTYDYTFENFIVGSSNRFAHAASIAVSTNPATSYNPLFIYGGSGLGKTHLLYAIQNDVRTRFSHFNIVYIKGEDFTNELIEAIKQSKTMEFKNKYRNADLLLVDDIQFIGGKETTQEEFFHTFNTLYEAKKQIVLTSDRPPKEIQLLEDRLRTRFEWGLLADIQSPDYELRMAIIQRKADYLKFTIPEDVVQFIANKLKSNIRQLEGAVKKTMAYYMLTGAPPSVAVAQSAIRDILNENEPVPITIDRIITEVGRYYNIPAENIKSKKRTADITLARQVAMYIIREITQMSLPSIGDEFSNRDHSTVHHAINKIADEMRQNSGFKSIVSDLIKNVREK